MVLRFFMMQSHYRSTLDITFDALKAAEKGFSKIKDAYNLIANLKTITGNDSNPINASIESEIEGMYEDMNNDFNTPKVIARIFELVSIINIYHNNPNTDGGMNEHSVALLQKAFNTFVSEIMGIRLKDELLSDQDNYTEGLMDIILELRAKARDNKDWPTSDLIRDKLSSLNIQVKDGKEGVTWSTSK